MGFLFKSKEEKEIKRLTGGILLSDEFKNKLKKDHLEPSDGLNIQKQLKKEVKEKKISLNEIEPRFKELYNEIINHKLVINDSIEYYIKIYNITLFNTEKDRINKEFRDKIFEGQSMEETKKEIEEIIKKKNPNISANTIEKRRKKIELEEKKKTLKLDNHSKKDHLVLKSFEEDEESKDLYEITVSAYIEEAKSLENKGNGEKAIIIYEKIVNEYRFGGGMPYRRLRALYRNRRKFDEVIRICDLELKNIENVGYLKGKNLMIVEKEMPNNNQAQAIKEIRKEAEIRLKEKEEYNKTMKENALKIQEDRKIKAKYKDNIEMKKIWEEEEKEKSKLIKEREEELNIVKKRYSQKYQNIESEKSQISNQVNSLKKPNYDFRISNRKIMEHNVEIPQLIKSNTALASTALFLMTGVLIAGAKKEVKWNRSTIIIYEDGVKINKKIKFEDITQNSYDKDNGEFYFLIKTNDDEIVFRTKDGQLLNDLNDAIENYHSKMLYGMINEENESIYQNEKSKANNKISHLNSTKKDTKKRQKMEEDAIYEKYRRKLQDLNRKYEKVRKEKLEELIEEEELKEEKEIETNQEDTEKTKENNEKGKEMGYHDFITSQGINIPAYDTPYDFEEDEEGEFSEKIINEEDPIDDDSSHNKNDGLVLIPFKESLNMEENVKAMQKYDETVLSYNDEGKMLEKNGQMEEAIIIYEKLVNEYKFGGNFPYDRLNAIYYKQNKPKEIIRICDLAIENLGHVGYLRGKELMIHPEVTSAGTKEKVKKFKDRKKREEKKLKKSEQKEKEKERQAQDQEIIEKCANDLELAQKLEEENKIDEAIKLYENVTKAKYPEKLPYNRLCILYRKRKNYKKELTTCNKAIRNLSNKKQKEWFKERKIKVQEKINN